LYMKGEKREGGRERKKKGKGKTAETGKKRNAHLRGGNPKRSQRPDKTKPKKKNRGQRGEEKGRKRWSGAKGGWHGRPGGDA